MTKKKHKKLLAKYGSEAGVQKVVDERKKVRRPLWLMLLIVVIIGISLSIMSYFKVF